MSECSKNALVSLQSPWSIRSQTMENYCRFVFYNNIDSFHVPFPSKFLSPGSGAAGEKRRKKNTVYISASEAKRAVVWGGEMVVSPSPVRRSARFAPRLKFLGKSRAKKRKTNCANITSFPCSVLLFKYSSRPISVREIAQFP